MDREAFEGVPRAGAGPDALAGRGRRRGRPAGPQGRAGGRVREPVRSAGCLPPYLPSYGYDLSPMEPGLGKSKTLLRKPRARGVAELWERAGGRAGEVLDQTTAGDAAGFFEHCGYSLHMD